MTASAEIVLVVPPFAMASYPTLGASLLAAGCRRLGLSSEVFHANLLFAGRVGLDRYESIASSSVRNLVGEAVFRNAAFPDLQRDTVFAPLDAAFDGAAVVGTTRHRNGVSREDAELCQELAGPFLDEAVTQILDLRPRIVGLSSVFQQNLASIAILRRLKRRRPELVTVLGGGNTSQPMGSALAKVVEACDVIFCGEADVEFPRFCREVLERGDGGSERIVECQPLRDLDATPEPDYTSYYEQLERFLPVQERNESGGSLPSWLHFETSRGCWYGEKSHCKFCGLNGTEMGYRAKTAERVVREVRRIVETWAPRYLAATDNIMPVRFRREVLPRLEAADLGVELFYEVKANLREEDLDQFVKAGVTMIQPGIESLATSILKRIAKGVTALQNVWLLRECLSRQIQVSWNLLTAIPGEQREDYESMLRLLPFLEHLQPPTGMGDVRFDRFSPYFFDAETYGITRLRPYPVFESLYPDGAELSQIAYHFAGDYAAALLEDDDLRHRFEKAVISWRRSWSGDGVPPRLYATPLGKTYVLIQDTRSCAVERGVVLEGELLAALRRLDHPLRVDRLERRDRAAVRTLRDRGLVLEYEGHYLGLVTDPLKSIALRRAPPRTAAVP